MTKEQQLYSQEKQPQLSQKLIAQPTQKDADGYIDVIFPCLNKSCNLEENNKRILEKSYKERCKVQKSVEVTNEEYDRLASSFMEDNDLWERIGGSTVDRADVEKHLNDLRAGKGLKSIEDWDLYNAGHNPCSNDYQNDHYMLIKAGFGYTNVLEVTSKGKESFYVNTEGFGYARYIGMAIYDDRINEDLLNAIGSNDLEDELIQKAESGEVIRIK